MTKSLVDQILAKSGVKKHSLLPTLSRIKARHNLRTTEQAACFYVLKKKLGINVSSIIDDRTQAMVAGQSLLKPRYQSPAKATSAKNSAASFPKIKWLTAGYYSLANRLTGFYSYLFLYENALRLKIDTIMQANYPNWWETKIKTELGDTYKYAVDRMADYARMPMLGGGAPLKPYDCITLGLLEGIVIKYKQHFVPAVFHNIDFFTGHMHIIKRVRNAMAHMSPSITLSDLRLARSEMDVLMKFFASLT